ncbi:MAG TPA: EAL domain-containing protein, partial [Acidimicrobiales bacterium]
MLAAIAMYTKAIDRVTDWSQTFNDFNLNGVMALLVLIPAAACVFAVRRYRDAMGVRQELARLSLYDTLTGLPNRRYLTAWLSQDIKSSQAGQNQAAVLFIDLDKFKAVNDTYGHEVGDQLMAAVADRLRTTLRPEDRIVRYGGDEFVVICSDVATPAAAERMATRLIANLEEPFSLGPDTMRISASVGVALAEHRGVKPEDVIRDADVAMYRAKARGSGQFTMFDRSMTGTLTPATAEEQIKEALAAGEFRLHYQPVVDLRTGQIVGAEALIRWATGDGGLIAPGEFIPILEETGLIVPVGTWVLGEACRQARHLRDLFPDDKPLKVTVNVSARQLAQVDFRDVITRALAESGAAHGQICLEITEGALMHDVASAWAVLRHAKALGVQLALDDFGTGYSSLSYIRRFTLDMLKIDKSFVDGLVDSPEDRAIIAHVIGMADALGMVTVAEGIEQPAQLVELQRLGCGLAQGYALSRPIPADEFEALLHERRHRPFDFQELTGQPVPDVVPLLSATARAAVSGRGAATPAASTAAATTVGPVPRRADAAPFDHEPGQPSRPKRAVAERHEPAIEPAAARSVAVAERPAIEADDLATAAGVEATDPPGRHARRLGAPEPDADLDQIPDTDPDVGEVLAPQPADAPDDQPVSPAPKPHPPRRSAAKGSPALPRLREYRPQGD